MKRVSRISSSEDFILESQRETLRDHRAERRRKSAESIGTVVCSILAAAQPLLIAGTAAITAIHAPALIAEVTKLL